MTDETSAPAPTAPADTADAADGERSTKAFWVKMGIGSAALAAALLYAKRPRGKKRF